MASETLIGTTLAGRFKIEALLGEGGMGTVYLARHAVLQRPFALKLMRKKLVSNATLAARFRREARAASRVQHANVTSVFDFGATEDGRPYMVQEYVRGESLARVILRERPFPLRRSLHVLAQVAAGLQAAHTCGVIHRDLKPANVLLTLRGQDPDFVKIHDFGLAKIVEATPGSTVSNISGDGLVFGTPEYLSPEQCMGNPADVRSDVYAYGVLAYELIAGEPPFLGPIMQVLEGHMERMPPPPSKAARRDDIPAALDALVERCLAKRPADRFASVAEVMAALEEIEEALALPEQLHDTEPNAALDATLPLTGPELLFAPPPVAASRDTTSGLKPRRSLALEELACAVRDRALGSAVISQALARKVQAEDRQLALQGRLADLVRRREELDELARQREGSLRFALAQLEHERERGGGDAALELAHRQVRDSVQALAREAEAEAQRLEQDAERLKAQLAALRQRAATESAALEGLLRTLRPEIEAGDDAELLALWREAQLS